MKQLRKNDQPSITFEDLPQAIGGVLSRLDRIELLLTNSPPELAKKPPVTTKELCKFLNVTEPTISRYRKKGIIPCFHIGSAIRYDLSSVIEALNKKRK